METFNFWDQMTFSSQRTPPLWACLSTHKETVLLQTYGMTPNIVVSQPSCGSRPVSGDYAWACRQPCLLACPDYRWGRTASDWLYSLWLIHCLSSGVPAVIVALCHLEVGGDGLPQPLAHQWVTWLCPLPLEDHWPEGDRERSEWVKRSQYRFKFSQTWIWCLGHFLAGV